MVQLIVAHADGFFGCRSRLQDHHLWFRQANWLPINASVKALRVPGGVRTQYDRESEIGRQLCQGMFASEPSVCEFRCLRNESLTELDLDAIKQIGNAELP